MAHFPDGFFDRLDDRADAEFYAVDRFVTHIDDGAIAAVSALYRELGIDGEVLDLCSSWISHFDPPPDRLVALGMNATELAANEAAAEYVVKDLNHDPRLPFDDRTFDAATCCVSVDYLTRPLEVFAEVARVLRDGGTFAVTFSNRLFPTKAIRGWLACDDRMRVSIVATYFSLSGRFQPARAELRNPDAAGDPLYAVWSRTWPGGISIRPLGSDPGADAGDSHQPFVTDMQYEALFVPPGGVAPDRAVLDEPDIARYHVDFGSRDGDVGRIATDSDGSPIGAAWVRQLQAYGWVDDRAPELAIAVVADRRGQGVGEALLTALIDEVPRMSLSVDERNPAKRLYERLGFETVRRDGESTVTMLLDRT